MTVTQLITAALNAIISVFTGFIPALGGGLVDAFNSIFTVNTGTEALPVWSLTGVGGYLIMLLGIVLVFRLVGYVLTLVKARR